MKKIIKKANETFEQNEQPMNEIVINSLKIDNTIEEQIKICKSMIKRNWIILGLELLLIGIWFLLATAISDFLIITCTYWKDKDLNRNKFIYGFLSIFASFYVFAPVYYIVFSKKMLKRLEQR